MRFINPITSIENSIKKISDNEFETAEITSIGNNGTYAAITKAGDSITLRSQSALSVGDTVRYRTQSLIIVDIIQGSNPIVFDV